MEQVKGIPGDILIRRVLESESEGREGREDPEKEMGGWMDGWIDGWMDGWTDISDCF